MRNFPIPAVGLRWAALAVALLGPVTHARAAESPSPIPPANKGQAMDYGPFLSSTVQAGVNAGQTNLVLKGVVIKLGGSAMVCFDTDTLRMAAGWRSTPLDISKTHLTSYKGSDGAFAPDHPLFFSSPGPGWANRGSFDEPRIQLSGPLPGAWGKYLGLYRSGEKVILHYRAGHTEIWELPQFAEIAGADVFSRTFKFAGGASEQTVLLCNLPEAPQSAAFEGGDGDVSGKTWRIRFAVVGGGGTSLGIDAHQRVFLKVPPLRDGGLFQVRLAVARGPELRVPEKGDLHRAGELADPEQLCAGGPSQWEAPVMTTGRRGADTGPYVVDHLTLPDKNPWGSWMRLTALDFFADGRAAVSTWNGDVWIVSGIDENLRRLSWKRFAAGLYEPLGLRIIQDQVYVLGRDQITRLTDLNADGEADHYQNFNNDGFVANSYHAFALDLQTDSEGNFYYTRCGHRAPSELPLNGAILKVSKDGATTSVYATGFRAANGLGIGPGNQITCSDNQGNWVPSSRLNWVKPGGFYGFVPHSGRPAPPKEYDPPLCWLPMTADNSSGGQVWAPAAGWGPLSGRLLHTSYGTCSLFLVFYENIGELVQGGVVRLPLQFDSGIMRGRFRPQDGQLYLVGLKGWTTRAVRDGCLERVRYTGKPLRQPLALKARPGGVEIEFSCRLDPASAGDPQNYAVEQWNYKWSAEYGSPDFSVSRPGERGRDQVTITSAELQPDSTKVFLKLAGLQPVMQMRVQFRIAAEDGANVAGEIYNTIHKVPAP